MPSGLCVTNNHVIEGADQVKVSLADKREFEADDRAQRSALRSCGAARSRTATRAFPGDRVRRFRRACRSATSVLAIGNPFAVGQTVTHGIVVGGGAHAGRHHRLPVLHPDRRRHQPRQFRRRAGRSSTGKLVGINTAIFSRSGGSQGIGFAIPANMVQVVVASARTGGTAVGGPGSARGCRR